MLDHPWWAALDRGPRSYTAEDLNRFEHTFQTPQDRQPLPSRARLLEIPVTPTRALVTLYLTPHPAVDAAIRRHRWQTYPIPSP